MVVRKFFFSIMSVFIIVMFFSSSLCAEVYRYVDENGVLHLSDKPKKGSTKVRSSSRKNTGKAYHSPSQLKSKFLGYVDRICREHDVDKNLVRAVIQVESNFNHLAVSPKGARGLMQLMPDTQRRYGVENPFDPYSNIEGGVKYLKYLIRLFEGDKELYLAAYNCGENRVKREGDVPNIKETQDYVRKVQKYYAQFEAAQPQQIVRFVDDDGVVHVTNRPGVHR